MSLWTLSGPSETLRNELMAGLDWIVVLGRVDCQGHFAPITEVVIIHVIRYGLQIMST